MGQVLFWVIFNGVILGLLALDLGVFHRKPRVILIKEAVAWCGVWIGTALLFNVGVYFWLGSEASLMFLTGYLIEYSLSIDNIFVFLLIFSYFNVPSTHQHKVLFWGILGAVLMRAIFIVSGVTLIQKFHFMIYVFGAFLVFAGIRMAFLKERGIHLDRNPILLLLRRWIPVADQYHDGRFIVRQNGHYVATPLFVVLLMIEITDVLFALDSIPAVLSITTDLTIVYTSNIFAILGLRSLYFAVSGLATRFYYLRYALTAILVFVGTKMLLTDIFKIPVHITLLVIVVFVVLSILASVARAHRMPHEIQAIRPDPDHDL